MFNKQLSNPRSKIFIPHCPIKREEEDLYNKPPSPTSVNELKNKAAGHSKIFIVEDGKKLAKPCNPQEAQFYLELHREPILEPLTAKFWEIRHIEVNEHKDYKRRNQTEGQFIILENLTSSFSYPCVMDLKLGNINYDVAEHKIDKIRLRKLKLDVTTAGKHGVRLSGLRVYRPRYDSYLTRTSKHFGDYLHAKWQLKRAIKLFLHDGYRIRTEIIPMFIQRLKKLLVALKSQKTFKFRASSVLFLYEGDLPNVNILNPIVDLRLIDFDHASISPEPVLEDTTGVTLGVSELIDIFKQILYSSRRTRSDSELLSITKVVPTAVFESPKGSISDEEN
jgi:hypothetical protein